MDILFKCVMARSPFSLSLSFRLPYSSSYFSLPSLCCDCGSPRHTSRSSSVYFFITFFFLFPPTLRFILFKSCVSLGFLMDIRREMSSFGWTNTDERTEREKQVSCPIRNEDEWRTARQRKSVATPSARLMRTARPQK